MCVSTVERFGYGLSNVHQLLRARSFIHPFFVLTLKSVIQARAAYSCIFIFSSRAALIHYCQLIRCKARWVQGENSLKN